MNSGEIVKILNKIEGSFPVWNWEFNDISIWPYIRFKIGSGLSGSMVSYKNFYSKIYFKYIKGFFLYFRVLLFDSNKNDKSENCDFLFLENGVHSTIMNRKYYYVRTDSIRDKLENKGYKCSTFVTGYKFNCPRYNSSTFIQYNLDFLSFKLKIKESGNTEIFLEDYDKFLSFISQNSLEETRYKKEKLIKELFLLLEYKKYFLKILKRKMPKAVFIVCFYSSYGFALIQACKELGIPIIDIQHGVQGESHYAYGAWKNIPDKKNILLPDFFYVWDEKNAEWISRWKNKYISTYVGGNDFSSLWEDSKNEKVVSFINYLKKRYDLNCYSKVILYTVGGGDNPDEEITKAILKSPSDWFWFIRLHPKRLDLNSYVKANLVKCNCSYAVDDVTSFPIYPLFLVSDVHVTERSSSVLEALSFGVKSIVTSEESKVLYSNEIENRDVYFYNKCDNIVKRIHYINKKKVSKKRSNLDVDDLVKILR